MLQRVAQYLSSCQNSYHLAISCLYTSLILSPKRSQINKCLKLSNFVSLNRKLSVSGRWTQVSFGPFNTPKSKANHIKTHNNTRLLTFIQSVQLIQIIEGFVCHISVNLYLLMLSFKLMYQVLHSTFLSLLTTILKHTVKYTISTVVKEDKAKWMMQQHLKPSDLLCWSDDDFVLLQHIYQSGLVWDI